MSMHLLPPMYSTTGKKKGKPKFRNAEAAAKARRNAEAWSELLSRHEVNPKAKITRPISVNYNIPADRNPYKYPSLDTGASNTAPPKIQQYTGTAMIGIGQLHKSNSIPVFQSEDAVDIAKMRRG
jgi:hypothetical protein